MYLGTSPYAKSGYSGTSGFSGNSTSGYSGFSSTSGYSGISGFSGAPFVGSSGYSGYSSTSGYSGLSGASGTSGYSGINQTLVSFTYANSFSPGQVIYKTSGGFGLAQANAISSCDILGVVQSATGSSFTIVANGYISGLTGLTDSLQYYLSDATPGLLTTTVPTAVGSVIKPVLIAIGTTSGIVVEYPSALIGGNYGVSGYYGKWTSGINLGTGLIYDNGSTVIMNSLSAGTISATNLYTYNEYTASAVNFTTIGNTELSGNTTVIGVLNVTNTTASTTTSAGALVVGNGSSGGLGVGGAGNFGGNLTVGTTPSSWFFASQGLQIPSGALTSYGNNVQNLSMNGYLNSSAAWTYITTNPAALYQQSNNTHNFEIAASGTAGNPITWTSAMYINGSGNVGIGTTSPSTNLQIGSVATNIKNQVYIAGEYNFEGAYLGGFNTNGGASLELLSHTGVSTSAGWKMAHDGDVYGGGNLVFAFSPAASSYAGLSYTQYLSLNASGVLQLNNGNTFATSGGMNSGVVIGNGTGGVAINTGAYDSGSTSTSYGWLNTGYANNAGVGVPMVFSTGGTEKMRLTSAGNLGVGTVSPSARLEVFTLASGMPPSSGTTINAALRIRASGGGTSVVDFGTYNSNGTGWIQATDSSGYSTNYNLSLNPNGGNVGIGAATPTYTLTVSGSIQASGNVGAYSDERVKKNWRDLGPDFVERFSEIKYGVYDRIDTELTQVGVGAQSLQKILPEAVMSDPEGNLSVTYGNAALAICVELAKEIKALKAEIQLLKSSK